MRFDDTDGIKDLQTRIRELEHDRETRNFAASATFVKVMKDNPDLCRRMTELLLAIKIKEIVHLSIEHTFASINRKSIRMDVLIVGSDEIIEIEMQTQREGSLPKRMRHYQAQADYHISKRSDEYDDFPELYMLSICKYDEYKRGRAIYRFETTCMDDHDLNFGAGVHYVIANTKGNKDDLTPELRALLNYIETNAPDDKDVLTMELSEATDKAYRDEMWFDSLITDEEILEEERKRVREQAMIEGRAEGLAEGLAEGRAEGLAEGEATAKAEDIALMEQALDQGLTLEEVLAQFKANLESKQQ